MYQGFICIKRHNKRFYQIKLTFGKEKGVKMRTHRQEYKRRWQAIQRATQKGLDAKKAMALYEELLNRGYSADFAVEGVLYLARQGAFGFLNGWERF